MSNKGGSNRRCKIRVGKDITYNWNGGSLLRGMMGLMVVSRVVLRIGLG